MTRTLAILSVTLLLFGATVALAQTTAAPPATPGGSMPPGESMSPGTPATPAPGAPAPSAPPGSTTTVPDTTPRTVPGDTPAPTDRVEWPGLSPFAWIIIGLVALGLIVWLVAASRRHDRDVIAGTRVERDVRPYDRDRDRAA